MDALIKLANKFIKLNINDILFRLYKKNKVQNFIINLNTQEQLREGLNTDGDVLGFYRSFVYASEKQGLAGRKATFGVVDLYVSGRFYKTFNIKADKTGFTISAKTDIYDTGDFDDIYGNVVGLTEENEEILGEYLLHIIGKEIIESVLE